MLSAFNVSGSKILLKERQSILQPLSFYYLPKGDLTPSDRTALFVEVEMWRLIESMGFSSLTYLYGTFTATRVLYV